MARSQPIVTGTSIIAIKYADGVMLSGDTLGSYGSLARFRDLERIRQVGEGTLVAAGGEYSDFQKLCEMLEELVLEEVCIDDGATRDASEFHAYISRVFYNRRNKMNPLWNAVVVAGHKGKDKTPFLGTVDHIGTTYTDDFIVTGFGHHLALPIIRSRWRADLSEAEARTLIEDCMRVCYYRDCRTINKIQLAKVTSAGVAISPPYAMETKWDYKSFVDPKAGAEFGGSW